MNSDEFKHIKKYFTLQKGKPRVSQVLLKKLYEKPDGKDGRAVASYPVDQGSNLRSGSIFDWLF